MKYLLIIAALFLVGCETVPKKEIVTIQQPILYCPAPNWGELDRPALAIDSINNSTSAGGIAQRYRASIKQLEDYVERLTRTLQQYDATNAAYEQLRQEFVKQRTSDGFGESE